MKSNQEIAQLLWENQEDFEPIVRSLHLPLPDFLTWMMNTDRNTNQTFWVMGKIGVEQLLNPISAGEELHSLIQNNKQEILKHFNSKFNVTASQN